MLLICDHNNFVIVFEAPGKCPLCDKESEYYVDAFNDGYDDGYTDAEDKLSKVK